MTLEFSEIACCVKGCEAVIVLHEQVEAKYRRTHESFHCPAGHSQHFVDKTREEKEIEALKRQLKTARRALDLYQADLAEALTCPWSWCLRSGYRYGSQRTFIQHLQRHHGLPEQVDPREEAEAS